MLHPGLAASYVAAVGAITRGAASSVIGTTATPTTALSFLAFVWLVCLKFTHFGGEVLKIGHPCPILSFEFCLTAKHRKNGTTAVHGGKAVKPNRQNVWCGARCNQSVQEVLQ